MRFFHHLNSLHLQAQSAMFSSVNTTCYVCPRSVKTLLGLSIPLIHASCLYRGSSISLSAGVVPSLHQSESEPPAEVYVLFGASTRKPCRVLCSSRPPATCLEVYVYQDRNVHPTPSCLPLQPHPPLSYSIHYKPLSSCILK